MEQAANGHHAFTVEHPECVELLNAVFEMALKGEVMSVAMVIVTSPGKYRVTAAGTDIDGMCEGAGKLQGELTKLIAQEVTNKKKKIILHA